MKIAAILEAKGPAVVTVRPEASLAIVVHRLELERIGAVVVTRDGERLLGLLSERDLVRALVHFGEELLQLKVEAVMSREVPTCAPDDSVRHAMALMTRHRVRHLPVLAGARLCGLVSIGDLVKSRLDELELETGVLRDAARAGA